LPWILSTIISCPRRELQIIFSRPVAVFWLQAFRLEDVGVARAVDQSG